MPATQRFIGPLPQKHVGEDPTSNTGKQMAQAWRELIEDSLMGNRDFSMGVMLWQELGRQQVELREQVTPATPQEQVKKIHVSLIFDPEAISWIEKALAAH